MKAAVFRGPNLPLDVCTIATPVPGTGEILVRVAACGLCHTDLHYLDHGVPTFKAPPLVLGHEAAGVVAALGPGVAGRREGDRVLIPAVLSCGRCQYCRSGRANLCDDLKMLGNNVDGAYAEYVVVPASEVFPLPDELPLESACVIADALSTPYHAVKRRGQVRVGDVVAVVGCGGVGLNVVQCAVAAGATVIAVDRNDARLATARELGAREVFNPDATPRVDKAVRQLTAGGVDVAFEAVGSPKTIELALGLLRKGGRLVVIGYSSQPAPLPVAKIMYHELEVVGSLGCGGRDYPEIIQLVQRGTLRLDPIVSGALPLEEINAGLDRLRQGRGVRWVVTP